MARLVQKEKVDMKNFVGTLLTLLTLQVHAVDLNQLLSGKLYLHVKVEPSQKIIETEPLKNFYALGNYAPLWTESGKANQAAMTLRQILMQADDWGLTPSQYLPKELVSLFDRVNSTNAVTLEILLSDAYLKFAQDLMNGQILDPDLIDEDIKMPRKSFDVLPQLMETAQRPEKLVSTLESLAPQHERYKKLVLVLRKLNTLKDKNHWVPLNDPKVDLKPGAKHSALVEVKKRLTDLGYIVSNQSNVYDAELQKVVARYQELNGLAQSKTLSRSFFRSVAPSLEDRINKIKANLEKFRWFPQVWEDRYLFVNMALQEMNVIESGKVVVFLSHGASG